MDLLINRSVVYELKAVKSFDGTHRRQLLTYLLLCLLRHGNLVNFRTPRVTSEFVSTSVDEHGRSDYAFNLDAWREINEADIRLKSIVEAFVVVNESKGYSDWGFGFLIWHSIYFSVCVWISIFLMRAPRIVCNDEIENSR